MNALFANWMTTIPGVLTLIGVVFNAWQTKTIDVDALRDAVIGVGLIGAKDFNVTGGSKSA